MSIDDPIMINGRITSSTGKLTEPSQVMPPYRTTEYDTGKRWINDEIIYGKVVVFGALPNNSTKNVAHGIIGLDLVLPGYPQATAKHFIIGNYLPLTYVSAAGRAELLIQGPDVRIVTTANFQDWTETYVTIEYTKTSQ